MENEEITNAVYSHNKISAVKLTYYENMSTKEKGLQYNNFV